MLARVFTALVLVALAGVCSGCSFVVMSKPPAQVMTPHEPVDCTDSIMAPVLDSIATGSLALGAMVLATRPDCVGAAVGTDCISDFKKRTGLVLSVGFGLVYAISAGKGFAAANRCRQVKQLNDRCIAGDATSCRTLRPDWTPPRRSELGAAGLERPSPPR